MIDARLHGFADRAGYAQARRRELAAALALAGWGTERLHELDIADLEAPRHLAEIARRLADTFVRLEPRYVITHAYEGGHQDHDATAFGAQIACRLLAGVGQPTPEIVEFALYHGRKGRMVTFDFVPWPDCEPTTLKLSRAERQLKSRMRDCFMTQRATLRELPNRVERLRAAPAYDFTQPPHPGPLHYERFTWAMRGAQWRARAGEALRELHDAGAIR
jgi:LmbE family N-acetylglucosaminyl deacetylase